jgi:hypothetical protein
MVKKSVNMRARITVKPKASQKMKRRTILFYATITVAFATIISVVVFTFLNLGNFEKAVAGGSSYTSTKSGSWSTGSTWNGSAPATSGITDNITINNNHTVTSSTLDFDNNATVTIKTNATLNITGNVTVNNNLVLNNSGNLIISGNFIVKNGASITINGTGIAQINGNFTLSNNNTVKVNGNLTVGNAITFGSNYTFDGTGFVSTGAGCNYWSGAGSCSLGSLPIKLLNFDAKEENGKVKLVWKTASEENNNFFTLERTADGNAFEKIGTVSGAGSTTNVSNYEFVDSHPIKGRSYYRLSQTDFDGKSEIFPAVTVEVAQPNTTESAAIQIYPNPLTGNVLTVSIPKPANGSIEIIDSRGNNILSQSVSANDSDVQMTLNDNVTPGIYFINYKAGGHKETIRLVKR